MREKRERPGGQRTPRTGHSKGLKACVLVPRPRRGGGALARDLLLELSEVRSGAVARLAVAGVVVTRPAADSRPDPNGAGGSGSGRESPPSTHRRLRCSGGSSDGRPCSRIVCVLGARRTLCCFHAKSDAPACVGHERRAAGSREGRVLADSAPAPSASPLRSSIDVALTHHRLVADGWRTPPPCECSDWTSSTASQTAP